MSAEALELQLAAHSGHGVSTGLWVGGVLMLAVMRAWLAGAAGAAVAAFFVGDNVPVAVAVGCLVTLAALPYRAVRAAQQESRSDPGEDRTDFRRGLILAMLMAVAALWLSMLTLESISNEAAALPGGMMGLLTVVATVASAAAIVATAGGRRAARNR